MRRIATVLISFALLCSPAVALSATAAEPAALGSHIATAEAATDPVARFGACLAAGGEGDFLMLIDESGSLADTDPNATRVTAVQYLLRQLNRFVDSSDVSLDVKLAVFGADYTSLSDWIDVGGAGLGSLSPVADGLAVRNSGMDTDYWTALENSRRDLADRKAARGEKPSCQAIAWFTDGQLDYDPRDYDYRKPFAPDIPLTSEGAAQQLASIATGVICNGGGLADQMRSSGIITFVVGLDASGPDFSLVEAIATGESGFGQCGDLIDPVPGTFTRASDIDQLLFAFDALGSPGRTPIQIESGICQVETCVEETHKFVLDSSTTVVTILASAEVSGLTVSLISPSGELVTLEPKTIGETTVTEAAGASAAYSWQSAKTLSIELSEVDPALWSGQWQLAFVDPVGSSADKKSFSNIRISSDFTPAVLSPSVEEWHVGDAFDLELGIIDGEGNPVDAASLQGTVALSAVLVDYAGNETTLADDLEKSEIGKPIPVTLEDVALGSATLSIELVHTTAPATVNGTTVPGTELQPQSTELRIPVLPPLDFPVATTTSLNFGVLDGITTSAAELGLSGSGCVWIDPSSISVLAGPEEAGDVELSAAATNAESCAPASAPFEIDFTVANLANGTVNGSFEVLLAPDGAPERAIPATIDFTADLRKPFNESVGITAFLLALGIGIGIPVGLIYLAKFLVATIPARALVSERVRVTVTDDGRVLRDGGPFALRPEDFGEITGIKPGGVRRLDVAGVGLSTRISASPSGAGYVVVDAPGYVSASDSSPSSVGTTPKARLPLAVHNHWIALRSPGAPASEADVILLLSGDADADRKANLVDDLVNRLPDVLERLVEVSGDAAVDEPEDTGFGSGGTSTGAGFGFDAAPPPTSSSSSSSTGFGFSD